MVGSGGGFIVVLIGFLIAFALYFLPTIVALARSKRNTGAILVVNLLLGWTMVGWIVALVWALTYDQPVHMEFTRGVASHRSAET